MYRWFLRHFPRGGSYADIHHALIEEGYTDWAESLVEYAWKKWLADENFAHQEVSSMQKLATDPGEIPFCSQFAAATIMLASAVVRITPESQPLVCRANCQYGL
ncbi:putative oxidoreductase subunit [Escherichia coli]|uniref:Putative oxidoreductase subunit n=1 Tax=Escherichia coli TaxID=562 RepID=A0A2X3KAP1_ECOLX|nr:putative oxidoreductase subunit [Escherichia coli]